MCLVFAPAPPQCLHTWCRLGRLPPRLYQVMVWGAWLATRQLRSRTCPLAREAEDDSMRTGYTTPWAGRARQEQGVGAAEVGVVLAVPQRLL